MRVTVREAARRIGASEEYVRAGLRQGRLPIGSAVKRGKRWAYNVSGHLLDAYAGKEDDDDVRGSGVFARTDSGECA